MKKLFIIPLIALCAMIHSASAQVQKSFVVRQPKFCQGFLITDGGRTDIDYWRLIISERTFDSNGFWSDEVIDRIEISDRNYYRIPSEYFVETASHEYMYTAEAWSLTSGKKDEVGPVSIGGNGIPWLTGNRFVCNGTTYAWAIQQDIHPSGCCQYHYSLTDATDFFSEPDAAFPFGTAVPFYEYLFLSDYSNLSNNNSWLVYHGLLGYEDGALEEIGSPVLKHPSCQ